MATWREQLASLLAPGRDVELAELQERTGQLEQMTTTLLNAYQSGQWELPPDELAERLREQYDPGLVDFLMSTYEWEFVGGAYAESGKERQEAVTKARRMWRYSELAQWVVWTWTMEGLGDAVQVIADDERAQKAIDEFWNAPRNAHVLGDDVIANLSHWLLVTGNRFLALYASTIDGECTIRNIPSDEIGEGGIVCNPADASDPWFYKREFSVGMETRTWYYPAASLMFDESIEEKWEKLVESRAVPRAAVRADRIGQENGVQLGSVQTGTVVCVLHIAHNIKEENSLWGWPIFTASQSSMRMHKLFLDSRLSVALAKAQYVRNVRVKGGSRAVQSVIDSLASNLSRTDYTDSNPPPAAGSTFVHNEAAIPSENPMTTGASDAERDNRVFSWPALLGGGLFQATAGLDVARYATALTMDRVQAFLFKQYSTFWSTQFQRIVDVVLGYQERYNGASYSTTDASVSIDTFSLSDLPDMVNALTPLLREIVAANTSGLAPAGVSKGVVTVLLRPILQALGTSWTDTQDLTGDEAWEMGDFEPEEEPEEETPPMVVPGMVPAQQVEEPETEEIPEWERAWFKQNLALIGARRRIQERSEQSEMESVLRVVARNYADGLIEADVLAENVLAAMVERHNGG